DVALLRSAVALPRDEGTLREVLRLRRSLAEVKGMADLGRIPLGLDRARALVPLVKQTGYRPLLGATLCELGDLQSQAAPAESEAILEEAVMTAEGAGDEETAARAASLRTFVVGFYLGISKDGMLWESLAHAL